MPYQWPAYVPAAQADVRDLHFRWDDQIAQDICAGLQDDELLSRQSGLSDRANFALAVGCTEWIVHRFHRFTGEDFSFPLDFLEALWAGVIDTRYMHAWEPEREEWSGPVCGPMLLAVLYAQGAAREASSQAGPGEAVQYLSRLAELVLPQPGQFLTWRDRTLDQLAVQFPFNHRDSVGDPVPRQALEQGAAFDMHSIEPLIQSFVAALDPGQNMFLNPPENMQYLFFEGDPRRFDLQRDRECRNEW
jgi:hypothetical protein